MTQNADYGRVIRVVGHPTRDEFWWLCHSCHEESEHRDTPTMAYGLALVHARWHGWDTAPDDHVVWGWLSPNDSSGTP
jgi:hypothetical protein